MLPVQVTHLVVDEVHERHLDADFLLAALREILPKRPELKIVMMSATLDAELFKAYYKDLVRGQRTLDTPKK